MLAGKPSDSTGWLCRQAQASYRLTQGLCQQQGAVSRRPALAAAWQPLMSGTIFRSSNQIEEPEIDGCSGGLDTADRGERADLYN